MNLAQKLVLSAAAASVLGGVSHAETAADKALEFAAEHVDLDGLGTIGLKKDLTDDASANGAAPDMVFVDLSTASRLEGGLAWVTSDKEESGIQKKARYEVGSFNMGDISFGNTNISDQLGLDNTSINPPSSNTGAFLGGRFERETTSRESKQITSYIDNVKMDTSTVERQILSGFAGVGQNGGAIVGLKKEEISTARMEFNAINGAGELNANLEYNEGYGFILNADDDLYRADYRIATKITRDSTTPNARTGADDISKSETNFAIQASLISEKGDTDAILYGHASRYQSVNPDNKAYLPDQIGASLDVSYSFQDDFNIEAGLYAGWDVAENLKVGGPLKNVLKNTNIGPRISIDEKGEQKVTLAARMQF